MFLPDFAAPSGVLPIAVFSEIVCLDLPSPKLNLMPDHYAMNAAVVAPDFPSPPKSILTPDQSPMHMAIVTPDLPSKPKFILIPDQSPMDMAFVFPDLPSKPK